MSRYRGPKLRIVRRLGELPGLTSKTPRKPNPPGQHGSKQQKPSQYGIRLMEKQKLRFNYGLSEHQLINYIRLARCAVEAPHTLLCAGSKHTGHGRVLNDAVRSSSPAIFA